MTMNVLWWTLFNIRYQLQHLVYVRLEGGKDEWADDLCEGSEDNEQPYAEFAEPWEDTDIVFVVEVS